jgi:hypothetical protein
MSGSTRAEALELLLVTLLAAAAAAALPLSAGQFGWSWDALNHHVYLGLVAESPRWHLDVLPASYQTYQYPYLYWPVYRLSQWQGPVLVGAALWSAFQASMLMLPTWFVCDRLLRAPGAVRTLAPLRLAACLAAVMSLVTLAGLETTSNDLLAAVPMLWAIAVSLGQPFDHRRACGAAVLCGVATAFKLSNAIFLPWLLLWWWVPTRPHWPWRRALALAIGAVTGFGVAYAPWGWQLWRATGNPFHPYFAALFGG